MLAICYYFPYGGSTSYARWHNNNNNKHEGPPWVRCTPGCVWLRLASYSYNNNLLTQRGILSALESNHHGAAALGTDRRPTIHPRSCGPEPGTDVSMPALLTHRIRQFLW